MSGKAKKRAKLGEDGEANDTQSDYLTGRFNCIIWTRHYSLSGTVPNQWTVDKLLQQ